MTSSPFCRFDLRTTDPTAAQRFYADVVGLDVVGVPSSEEPSMLAIWLLHEQARARGAVPHWLGHIGVADVETTVHRLLDRGSERLGPSLRASDGTPFAILRDPSGAVLAVRTSSRRPLRPPVAWHHLHTRDLDGAWDTYSQLFGWTQVEPLDDVTDAVGRYRVFAWEAPGPSVGSMANTARREGVHPHWLFFFSVADIEHILARVRAHGGQAPTAVTVLPNGARVAACEDGQGAAFGLYQPHLEDVTTPP
jgi:predicted enzyme related to lactoylglutathione lyase